MPHNDPNQFNPYIRVAMESVLPPAHNIHRRIIFDYELIFIRFGQFILTYGEQDFHCGPGQFLLLRPGIPHSFHHIREDISQPHIHFDLIYRPESPRIPISFKDLDRCSPEERSWIHKDLFEGYPLSPFVRFSRQEQALRLFFSIVSPPQGASALSIKAAMLELMDQLIRDNFPDCFTSPGEAQYGISRQLKDFLDAGQGVTMSLAEFEKQFSYSRYYLEREFHKHYGMGLIAYRNQKRMQLALELLEELSVSRTAERLGFSSVYAFSRAFRNHFGFPPSAISKRRREETT